MNPSATRASGEGRAPEAPAHDRRRYRRSRESFPATLVVRRGILGGTVLRGVVQDHDPAGARVLCPEAPDAGTRVRVRLHLPRSLSDFFRGLPCEFGARVVGSRPAASGGAGRDVILEWDRPLPESVGRAISSYQRKAAALLLAALTAFAWLRWRSLDDVWYAPAFYVYSVAVAAYLLSRFALSWRHKTPEPGGYLPPVSVVIPVRNEEAAIRRTVETCYQADYPAGRREIIVVDDGSTDRTPELLGALRERHPDLVVRTLPPSGKRAAMAEGVLAATGEIVVFVDSDTFLFADALRNIVCGFEDPTLGASAGYAEVENADVNALTGLQEVRYFVSYRLLKSAESVFGTVTCCPGCLSAYRRAYVLEFLDEWRNQTFLGEAATFGDDRSLTNFILRRYRAIYNDRAVASTLVPETWGRYLRQQLRWKKSWARETLIASGFMWRKHPVAAVSFYSAAALSLLSPAMALRVVWLALRGHEAALVWYGGGVLLTGLLLSLYFLQRRPSPHWALGILWMMSCLAVTGPQTYYALATMRRNHWGTR